MLILLRGSAGHVEWDALEFTAEPITPTDAGKCSRCNPSVVLAVCAGRENPKCEWWSCPLAATFTLTLDTEGIKCFI